MKSITEPTVSHTVPENLEGRITSLKEIVDNPKWYVKDSEHYDQFKQIILGRVAAKINEIQNLSPEEKQKYIANQKKVKEGAMANQEAMRTRQAPASGSEAHVISEQQWLQEMQAQFQQGFIQNAQQANPADLNRIQSEMDQLRVRLDQLPSREDVDERAAEATARLEGWRNVPEEFGPGEMIAIQLEMNEINNARNERLDIETRLANLGLALLRLQLRNAA